MQNNKGLSTQGNLRILFECLLIIRIFPLLEIKYWKAKFLIFVFALIT